MEEIISREILKMQARLVSTWDEIGLSIDDEKQKVTERILLTLKNILDEENMKKNDLIQSIDDLGSKIFHLTESLKMAAAVAEPEINMSLLDLEHFLKEKVQEFEAEASKRIQLMRKLKREEEELCIELSEEPSGESDEKIPSEENISHVRRVIKTLHAEKVQREKTVNGLKAAILAHMNLLEIKPVNDLQSAIVSGMDNYITLSNSTIKEMKKLSKDLENKVQENRDMENQLQEQIQMLWDRLNIDQEHRDYFFSTFSGRMVKDLVLLQAEVQEMEALKKANLSLFIGQLREELLSSWEKCFIADEDRKHFNTDAVTEAVLESLEKEVNRLKTFYAENEDIFTKLGRWQTVWMKVRELDERMSDPKRLFENRGCALLQEERERKRVTNELPRLEKYLESKIEAFENEHQKSFLIFGTSLEDFIRKQWENYNLKKEREKIHKQEQRNEELHKEARFGTVKKVSKRAHPTRSDTLRNSKFQKMEQDKGPSGSGVYRTQSRTNLTILNQRGLENGRVLRDHVNIQAGTYDATLDSSRMPTYSKFSEAIQTLCEQENVRSSVRPSSHQKRPAFGSPLPRTPKGLPKTPCMQTSQQPKKKKYYASSPVTLPRAAPTRRISSRLNNSRFRSPVTNSTIRTPYSPSGHRLRPNISRFASPSRNKLSFLM